MDNIAAVPIESKEVVRENYVPAQHVPVVAERPTEQPFSMYKDMNQVPYTASHFGLSKSQYFALREADITDLTPKIDSIENLIKEQILTGNYKDSTDTYKQIIEDISKELGIKSYESNATKIEKIFLYLNGGKGLDKHYQIKRSSRAETIDQAKHQAMKALNKEYPNKSSRLSNFTKFF